MKAPVEMVESIHESAVREINALEQRIAASEDDADAKLWEQAETVHNELEAGLSSRKLAEAWINARTGKPYDKSHVNWVRQTWLASLLANPRPRFRDAYNAIANPKAHVANNSGNNEWYTPPEYIEAARDTMGGIDCDPASSEIANRVVRATTFYTISDNGLSQTWGPKVWMNPPYAQPAVADFSAALVDRLGTGEVQQACVLVNNATETGWCQPMIEKASAVCLVRGRVRFSDPDGNPSGAPLQGQIVIYMGERFDAFRDNFARFGVILYP